MISAQDISKPKLTPRSNVTPDGLYILYAYDMAFEMSRRPVPELLGHPVGPILRRHQQTQSETSLFLPATNGAPAHDGIARATRPYYGERAVKILPVGGSFYPGSFESQGKHHVTFSFPSKGSD
jgi:hypothetical protein